MREGAEAGCLHVLEREKDWLDNMADTVGELPKNEDDFIADQLAMADGENFCDYI